MTLQSIVESYLQPYRKSKSGSEIRYTNPLRSGADGETLAVNYDKETWYDHKDEQGGHLSELAKLLGLEVPSSRQSVASTKRSYDGLPDYARAHALRPEQLKRYKWTEVSHQGRPALKFPTEGGHRYRFIDGNKPVYKSDKGYKPCWYGIGGKFAERLADYNTAIFCNGEISTIAAAEYGLPAFCVTSGEKAIPQSLLNELGDLGKDPQIIVALDCDKKGRDVAAAVVEQFRSKGYQVRAVDLGLTDGGDLADWLMLHNNTYLSEAGLMTKLSELPELTAPPAKPGDGASASQRPPRFEAWKFDDMWKIPPPKWIIEGKVQEHGFNVVFGPSGAGKTFLSIGYAFEIAQNKRVMYVAGEGISGLYARGMAWCQHNGGQSNNVTMILGTVAIMDDIEFEAFRQTVAHHKPEVLFVDTLARSMVGTDENSGKDMMIFVDRLNELQREFGLTVVVIHHTNKGGLVERGSGALRAAADNMILVTMIDDEVVVECVKTKESSPFESLSLALLPVKMQIKGHKGEMVDCETPVLIPSSKVERGPLDKLTNMQRKVLEVFALESMDGTCTPKELADILPEINGRGMQKVLSSLKRRGLIGQSAKRDPYTLTTEGRRALGLDDDLAAIVTNHGPQTPPSNIITPNPDMFDAEDLAAAVDPVAYYGEGL